MPFEISLNDTATEALLRGAVDKVTRPEPLMRTISTEMATVTALNFLSQGRPRWLGLKNPSPRRANGMILQDKGRLRDSVTPFNTDTSAGVGSNLVYAAIHHLGGQTRPHAILPRNKQALAFGNRVVKKVNHPGSKIEARPFLPIYGNGQLQPEATADIEAAVQDYLRSIMAG